MSDLTLDEVNYLLDLECPKQGDLLKIYSPENGGEEVPGSQVIYRTSVDPDKI